jgi:8-oxo-dGTP diphosphatase
MEPGNFCYEYPRPMVTVDAVIMAARNGRLEVLLIQRKADPCSGMWALPGGFVNMDESLDDAVVRELEEETGLTGIRFSQLHTFGNPGRDPRGRSISTAYLALVDASRHSPNAADDAEAVCWRPVSEADCLAFDHAEIVAFAIERLRHYASYAGVGAQALPEHFTLDELRELHEVIEGKPLDPAAFEARVKAAAFLTPSGNGHYRLAANRTAPV